MKWLKKVAATPLTNIAKVIDSIAESANDRRNAPSIRATRAAINNMWEVAYPVGSIYISTGSANPSTLFGGTWQRITDKFILASGTTYQAGTTGGAASVSYTPAGTVGDHALTVAEIPPHRHLEATGVMTRNDDSTTLDWDGGLVAKASVESVGNGRGVGRNTDQVLKTSYAGGSNGEPGSILPGTTSPHSHGFTGTAANISTLPPYLAVYVWERTA